MNEKIGVIGLGYVGLPLSAALANVGFYVIGLDIDERKTNRLQQTYEADIYEPGLNEILKRCKDKIEFTSNHGYLMKECDVIIITVGTPLMDESRPNFDSLNKAITVIGKYLRKGQLTILKSTVLPGITRQLVQKLEELSGLRAGLDFYMAFCPERTVEGRAIDELQSLPKIIGGFNAESSDKASAIMGKLGGKIIQVSSLEVAEICKLVDNTYRLMNIAFANELGYLCEKIGIDAYEVASVANDIYNRTNIFLSSLGAGGPCLSKDPQILAYYAKENNIDTRVIHSSIAANKESIRRVISVVSRFIESTKMEKAKISLLGLAFKGFPETDDIRNSPAIDIEDALREKFKNLIFGYYDPLVKRFSDKPVSQTLNGCIEGSNVVMFLTNHNALVNVDAEYILSKSSRPLLIVDCWHNVKGAEKVKGKKDIQILRIGDGRL